MDAAQLLIKEEDIIKIILEFLSSKHYHVTLRTLEKESNTFNCDYSDEVFFLRELILDGDFNEVIDFGRSFASSQQFNQKQFNYIVLRQKFIELIYLKFHLVDINDTKHEQNVDDVMKTLRDLESCCPTKDEYSNLCWLLTVPDLNAQDEFRNWRVDVSRLKCFEELLICLSNLMPLVKKRKGNTKIAGKDRLLQLLVKGLFYESCIDYCQSVASATEKKPVLSLKNELLESTVDNFPSNLLSWIHCLPLEVFNMPFEHTDIDICVSNVVTKQIVSLSSSKKEPSHLNLSNNEVATTESNQSIQMPPLFHIPDEKQASAVKNNAQHVESSAKTLLQNTFTKSSKKSTSSNNNNNDINNKTYTTKTENTTIIKDTNDQGKVTNHLNHLDKISSLSQDALDFVNTSDTTNNKNPSLVKIPKRHSLDELPSDVNVVPLSNFSKFQNLSSSVEHLRASAQDRSKDRNLEKEKEIKQDLEFGEIEYDQQKRRVEEETGKMLGTYDKKHVNMNEAKASNIPDPIRIDFDFNENEDCNLLKTPTATKFQEKKKKELFDINTSTPKPTKKTTPKPSIPNASPVKKNTVSTFGEVVFQNDDDDEKFEIIEIDDAVTKESETNTVMDKENAYNEEGVVLGPVINGVRRPISAGYLNSSNQFDDRHEIADFKSKKKSIKHKSKTNETPKNHREPMQPKEDATTAKRNVKNIDSPLTYASSNADTSMSATAPHTVERREIWKYSPMAMIEDAQAVRSVAFNSNGSLYAVGANSKILRICKLDDVAHTDDQVLPSMSVMFKRGKYHRGSIYCMGWSADGQLLATGSNDKSIKILKFDARTFNQIGEEVELNIHSGTVRELSFVPNRSGVLISGGAGDGCVHVSDVITQKLTGTFDGHSGNVLTVYAGDGDIVATGGTDNTLRLWDLRSQRCIDVVVVGDSSPATVALSGADKFLASGQEDGSILLYDLVAGRTLQNFRLHQSDCRSVRFSPDSSLLLTASYDTTISLLHLNKDLEIAIPNHYIIGKHSDKVIQTRWHPTENYFLSSSADRTAVLWKADL